MGLDVYLYAVENVDEQQRKEAEYNRVTSEIWDVGAERYEDLTAEQKDECRQLTNAAKVRIFGEENAEEYWNIGKVEEPHPDYPDHLFKIGYWRSSYNRGGINSLLQEAIGLDLYHLIEGMDQDTGDIRPAKEAGGWEGVLNRAEELLRRWREHTEKPTGKFRAMDIGFVSPRTFDSYQGGAEEAVRIFAEKYEARSGEDAGFRSFSCGEGTFYLDGIKVFGMVPGFRPGIMGGQEPVVYLIYEYDDEALESYTQSLEIVRDTCKYVLDAAKAGDAREFYLGWSS